MQQHPASLLKIDFRVSTACADPSHAGAWSLLRDFGNWGAFMHAFGDKVVQTTLVPGSQEMQIGARRVMQIGGGKLVEQLSALDDENMTLSYKLISHPANINPFNGSFVNYTCHLSVRSISMNHQSYVEMRGSFMTDPSMVDAMQFSLSCFHETCLRSLCEYLGRATQEPARRVPSIGISEKHVGSFELYANPQLPIGRTLSAHHADPFSVNDRQNSSDSTRSQLDGSNPMQ